MGTLESGRGLVPSQLLSSQIDSMTIVHNFLEKETNCLLYLHWMFSFPFPVIESKILHLNKVMKPKKKDSWIIQ